MHIDMEIENVEEEQMETSDDESTKDETYRMSPVPPSENSIEKDDESNDSQAGHEAVEEEEEEEEGMVEGTLNPRSCRRDPFDPSPTIRVPHKSLLYVVANYKVKGATKRVKKLRKVDPRSEQKDASDYRLHTHF
jgi:hypothetical protein